MVRLAAALLLLQLSGPMDVPQMPEVHKYKIQALFYKHAALDLQIQQLEAQEGDVERQLEAETKAVYAETKVDPKQWVITSGGDFKPKEKP